MAHKYKLYLDVHTDNTIFPLYSVSTRFQYSVAKHFHMNSSEYYYCVTVTNSSSLKDEQHVVKECRCVKVTCYIRGWTEGAFGGREPFE